MPRCPVKRHVRLDAASQDNSRSALTLRTSPLPLHGHGHDSVEKRPGPRRRRAERALGLPRSAALAVALRAAGALGPADRLAAAAVAVLVVGGARRERPRPAGRRAGDPAAVPWTLLLFLIGAIAMRGAGCTYNDIVDEDIDAQVERTRSRPLPSGQVDRRQAWIFLGLQALAGLAVLLQFNSFAILLGIASLAVVAIYPFMKRFTNWPQLVLGLAFSWGALMGWAVEFAELGGPAILLYLGSVLWVIGYDTIYAHQDKEDDAIVGVRSTARLFGDTRKPGWSASTAVR